ncbi:hypothetical protein RRG08_040239 [Elysia crispata]|uniref:Uncharacterized protein n=1 Tax=Elysia crispata TaxID=231223 RepID=A0AAE0YH25_9GAST|nr:hypothetical protein RRG08_040239 [Elysia crispata]
MLPILLQPQISDVTNFALCKLSWSPRASGGSDGRICLCSNNKQSSALFTAKIDADVFSPFLFLPLFSSLTFCGESPCGGGSLAQALCRGCTKHSDSILIPSQPLALVLLPSHPPLFCCLSHGHATTAPPPALLGFLS